MRRFCCMECGTTLGFTDEGQMPYVICEGCYEYEQKDTTEPV